MKPLFASLLICLAFPALVRAQKLEAKKIYSQYVGDSILVKTWLPKDYSPDEKYPAIYEFIYDHSNYIAATASNLWNIPKVIVVWADIEGGNDDYTSPDLTEKGGKYYAFVKNELLPYISGTYHTTGLKVAAGLSQGGDYLNYILRNDPALFSSYLVFSTEYPIHYTPDFSSYTAKIKDSLSYFIAVANDEEERMKFADRLYDSLKTSRHIRIKKEYFANASHPYSILYALPDALLFAFDDYASVRQQQPGESLLAYYRSVLEKKKDKFGTIYFNSLVIQILQQADIKNSSPDDINGFMNSVYDSKEAMDIDLFNIGYTLRSKGLYMAAEKAYRLALQKKETTGITRMDDLSTYFALFKTYDLEGRPGDALKILQEGYEKTKARNEALQYMIGYYYIDQKIDIAKRIELLKSMLTGKHQVSGFWAKPDDEVCVKIATAYGETGHKKEARIFVNKALAINPANEAALRLSASLK